MDSGQTLVKTSCFFFIVQCCDLSHKKKIITRLLQKRCQDWQKKQTKNSSNYSIQFKKQGRSIIIHYQISLLFWKSAILKRRRWKKDIITEKSHSLCYFTPSKKQGRRNFWANAHCQFSEYLFTFIFLESKSRKKDQ